MIRFAKGVILFLTWFPRSRVGTIILVLRLNRDGGICETMLKVVIDTNVLVSALRSDMGAAYSLISKLPSNEFQFALSVPLYAEYHGAGVGLEGAGVGPN